MENNLLQQSIDASLQHGMALVMNKTRTLSDVAPTLINLLQNDAKWDRDTLPMPDMMTPYHVICGSSGDHHQLLELMIKDLGRSLLNAKDTKERTPFMCAVQNLNVNCVRSLIANGADVNLMNNTNSLQEIPKYRYVKTRIGPPIKLTSHHQELLTKSCLRKSVYRIRQLLGFGADPNINVCAEQYPSAINVAISNLHVVEVIAYFIRGGVNVNKRSYLKKHRAKGMLLPFEVAVCMNNFYALQMLLVSGCLRGGHILGNNIHKLNVNIDSDILNLLKIWKVHRNPVQPLKQRCRMVILNHLSPQADQKITELPLPPVLTKYLRILELEDIIKVKRFKFSDFGCFRPQTNYFVKYQK